jgi:hypothetical protein
VKRFPGILLLLLASAPAFSQARQNVFVYLLDINGGTAGERRFFSDNLRMEIPAAGYALTDDILEADYALSCSIRADGEGRGRLLLCSLVDAKNETEIASATLLYNATEETYGMLPYMVWTVFSNAPLKQGAPEREIAEIEGRVPAYLDARGTAGSPGGAGPPDAWKHRRVFLNLRAGLSSRYYLGGSDSAPTASILTFDGGLESELCLFNVLALQLGLNFALDQAEYRRSPSNPTPMVCATSVMSVPLMVKYIFNPSPLTNLGPYLGAFWTSALLGAAKPPPFGLLAGLDLSAKTGMGVLLFDLRYGVDLGRTDTVYSVISYHRMFVTLSGGYKFGFIKR